MTLEPFDALDEHPCLACSTPTADVEFCTHSRDPICATCCGRGGHTTYCGGVE